MKILVIGLDAATPETLFDDEQLINFHRLMEFGCYGSLESTLPLTPEQAWLCLATGQEPGENRSGDPVRFETKLHQGATIWGQIVRQGKRAIITGWLPFEPTDGKETITYHLDNEMISDTQLPTDDEARLKDQVYSTSRKQFEKVQQLLQTEDWYYFQFIETGLGQIQRAFRQRPDTRRTRSEPDNPNQVVVRDYYRYLDAQLEIILETLTDDTVVLVVSIRGTQPAAHQLQDTDLNSNQLGFFILAAPNNPLSGEVEGARLIDIAPTLLELGGYAIPDAMQGESLVSGMALDVSTETGLTADEEEILRERLSGLGYIS